MAHATAHGGARGHQPVLVGRVGAHRAATISALLLMAGGVALAAVHHVAGDQGSPESWLASVAFGLPLFAAGVVALLGARSGRPALWIAAGAAACPIAVVSVIGFLAVIPAIALVVLGVTHAERLSRLESVVAAAIAVLLVGVFALLVFHEDPATWTTPTGGGSSSNIITGTEIAATVGVVMVVLAAAVAVGRPRSSDARGGETPESR